MKTSLFLSLSIIASAVYADTGIASGQPSGTNHPMVEDIVKTCSVPGNQIRNRVSNGSLENIQMVYDDKTTQYGIAQEDALVYQKGVDKKMMEQIVMVFPFFSTEVHLVVAENSPIKTLADLQGKRVVEGPDGSGTWVTTQVIKGLTELSWKGSLEGQSDGMNALLQGKVDAMFINAGKPVGIISKTQGIRLIPLSHSALDSFKFYTKTMISTGTYPFQKSPVNTYKVRNGLITYNYKQQYHKDISTLVTCIGKNLEQLQKTGHPKWRDVDPKDITAIQWPVHPAALSAIKGLK